MKARWPRTFKGMLLVLMSFYILGCATVYNPATKKQEFILIDTASEVALGSNVARGIAKEYTFSQDRSYLKRIETIGAKIASVSDRSNLKYHFHAIEDEEINAFALPGGYIYVNTGLMDEANDDELACVLAHELGHVAARHSIKRLQADLGYQILMSLAFRKAEVTDLQRAIGITFNLIGLGYSREDELLADRLGIKYAKKAGYNPEAMVSFLKKLNEIEKENPLIMPVFLRSHPPVSQRIRNAEKEIALLSEKPQTEEKETIPSSQKSSFSPQRKSSFKDQILGTIKFCPSCGKNYPSRYKFCPQDGSELLYKN